MISSNSTWDRESYRKDVSPSFSRGRSRVTFEFRNRRSTKIFSHSLGRVTFLNGTSQELNSSRDQVIVENYGKKTVNGYVYKTISHSHVLSTVVEKDEEDRIPILGHGFPVKGGWENCAISGSTCVDGESNTKCESAKCKIGTLSRVSGDKWRYDSLVVEGLYYFVYGKDSVKLKGVSHGKFPLPAGSGVVEVSKTASIPVTVYLPPSTYAKETFTRSVIKTYFNDSEKFRSITDTEDNFIRAVLFSNFATEYVEEEVKERLLRLLKGQISSVWYEIARDSIEKIWQQRIRNRDFSNRDFLIQCYEELGRIYQRSILVSLSGLSQSRVYADTEIGRPIYGRLPGISGSYNDESSEDTVAKWLTSGADSELSSTKTLLDRFYRYYLDPDICYPLHLDWLAQHFGFIGGLWNLEWNYGTKRLLLKNAHVNNLSGGMWSRDSSLDTLRRIDLSRIEGVTVDVDTGKVSTSYRYTSKVYDEESGLTVLEKHSDLSVDTSNWNGILPSKGTLISLLFMFWASGVKAISAEELTYDESEETFSVKDGLRSSEFDAPVNTPYIVDVLRVGDETDAMIGNYGNQLIADVSTCQDDNSSNMTVIRMPFYYNKNGRSWDATEQIIENYVPATSEKKVQYAYAVSDLLAADNIFFEPEIADVQ